MSGYNELMYEGIDHVPGDYDHEYTFTAELTVTCDFENITEFMYDLSHNQSITGYSVKDLNTQTKQYLIYITYTGSIFAPTYESIERSDIIKAIDIDGFELIGYWID